MIPWTIHFHDWVIDLEIVGPDSIAVDRAELSPNLLAYLREHKAEIIAAACAREWEQWQSERPAPGGDPRPALVEDSAQWATLLSAAYELDGDNPAGTWAALHVVRCMGAAIAVHGGKWRIERGDYEPGEWAADRARYLAPRTAAIKCLLAAMGEKQALGAPESAGAYRNAPKCIKSGELKVPTGDMLPLFGQEAVA